MNLLGRALLLGVSWSSPTVSLIACRRCTPCKTSVYLAALLLGLWLLPAAVVTRQAVVVTVSHAQGRFVLRPFYGIISGLFCQHTVCFAFPITPCDFKICMLAVLFLSITVLLRCT